MNLAVVGSCTDPPLTLPILAGAILPDVPIMLLYVGQRLRSTPDDVIWAVHYQKRFWQNVIHTCHSIPLTAIGLLASWALASPVCSAFFGSALLHACSDLPVHHKDAHRHFLPFSQYRFISPLSYWDVQHHGRWVALVEWMLVLVATAVIWRWNVSEVGHVLLGLVNVFYVVNYWRHYLRPLMKAGFSS